MKEPFETSQGLCVHASGAAIRLGVSPITMRRWRRQLPLPIPFIRVGNVYRYRVSDLDAYLEARRVTK